MLDRLGDPATKVVEVYSVSVERLIAYRLGSSTKLSYRPLPDRVLTVQDY
jgi:hypothetical protein